MKVIIEEDMMAWFKEIKKDDLRLLVIGTILLSMCKEIDTLAVNKLRPMYDAPLDDETILCVGRKYNTFIKVYYDGVHYKDDHNELYNYEDFIGWIPYPVYKP